MARIYRRGKTWSFSIDIERTDASGKRKRKTKGGFRTQKEAKEAAAIVEIELARGTYVEEKNISFRQFAEKWLDDYAVQVKKSSIRIRNNQINNLYKYFDQIQIKKITKMQYQKMIMDLHKKNLSYSTLSGIHGAAKMIFKKAIELDIIKNDPTQFARLPRQQQIIDNAKERIKYLEKDQLVKFLDLTYINGIDNDYLVFLTLAYTGIRAGELCALQWSDIDFKEKTISINKTYYNPNNNILKYELLTPKTKTSKRTINVTSKVLSELDKHKIRQNYLKMKNRDIWHDGNFVFTSKKYLGYPIYIKLVEIRMERLLRISGLDPHLTPHSLRHTHTSLLAEAGVGLEEIMERLGHSDGETTRKIYLHVTQNMKKEAAEKFEKLMS